MTEERKQELEQLLGEAMESLVIRYGYGGPLSIPVDVYRRYLQERWASYGVDFLSFSFSARFTLDIVSETTKSNLLDFIRAELSLFIDEDNIPLGSYVIESDPTDGACLSSRGYQRRYLYLLVERLLEITLVRGIEEAISVFDRCSCPEGAHGFFQDVAMLEGIKLKTEIQIFEGVRLVPLPSSKTSEELTQYLPGFPSDTFIDQVYAFSRKTLLVIERSGFSIFHEPAPDPTFPQRCPVGNLPFQVEVHDVKFPNFKAVNSFQNLFCQALSLVCGSPVQIVNGGWFLAADKSFNPDDGITGRGRFLSPFGSSTEAGEAQIDEAKRLYHILINLNSRVREKLRIPIDRWIMSKTNKNYVDKMIDLGIAFESVYLSDINPKTELSFRFRLHASWHLGTDKEHRKVLMKEFRAIYDCRSDAVHKGKLDEEVKIEGEPVPMSEFIERAQDLCRESIMKILEAGEFPNWDDLILG